MRWLIIGLFFLTSCELIEPQRVIEIQLDTRLPKDVNGYSYFKLYSSESQNIHRISGTIRRNGRIPDKPREKVEWKSNLYWHLKQGEPFATVTKTYINEFTGQLMVVKLPPLISNISALVPTINENTYNSADGTINTIIAPTWEMRGDTMTVVAKCGNVVKIAKIIIK
jgi:hypothetical protein